MKVMCLGDNSSQHAWGHHLTKKLAESENSTFRGMVPDDLQNLQEGYYHIGPVSMQPKDIIESTKKFDRVVLLDQDQDKFSDHRIFLAMFKLVNDLKEAGINVEIKNAKNMQYLYYWTDMFEKNKSICVYPWLLMHDSYGDYTSLCGRSLDPVANKKDLKDWSTNPEYTKIRNKMLEGVRTKNCRECHRFEDAGIKDQRWNYSFDWIARLRLQNVDELKKIKKPMYYEVRPSNKCNAMCRMCNSEFSHLIEKENNTVDDPEFQKLVDRNKKFELDSSFDHIDADAIKRLYVAGGEPTVINSVYKFMQKCIDEGKTSFTFNMQTNGLKIKDKFFNLCKQFSNLTISTSVDGVGKVNEYQRWKTDSELQRQNIHRFHNQGNKVHIISVISLYNIATLGETMEFFDKEFPYAPIQLQWAGFKHNILDPFNHPNRQLVFESIQKAKKTKCYWHNESGTTNFINRCYDFFGDPANADTFDRDRLRKFFYYNDTLDKQRGSRLADYIPTLEDCRKHIIQQ